MEESRQNLIEVKIEEELQGSYLDYAMSVIIGRALPDIRDGLKPVQRRILYAMLELGMEPNKPYKKSARVVGEVLGKYHPHGDAPVYDALVRMVQDFTLRHPLVDGHGNFGSIDGDEPAAMRYTEVRLSPISMELLKDIEKDTVDFMPNFDESLKEPVVLPASFPNVLVNGSSGIAVGMATNIPSHNLKEVIDALIYLIDHPECSVEELMNYIPGPDFPSGGIIRGRKGIIDTYTNGRGHIVIEGKIEIEEHKGRQNLVITELPYQVNKSVLIEKIANLMKEHTITGIQNIRDESDREGMRILIELKREAIPQVVINQLYKHTALRTTFGSIMLVISNGIPKIMPLDEILREFLIFRKEVVKRRTLFDLNKARQRAHILEGLLAALDHIDEVISLIRSSHDVEEARNGLMSNFQLSKEQAQAILDLRLQRLTALERERVEEEYKELLETIKRLNAILEDERILLGVIKEELFTISKRFSQPRKTVIAEDIKRGEDIEDLLHNIDVFITLTERGYIRRLPLGTYKKQRRGGKGIIGLEARDDRVAQTIVARELDKLLLFSNKGLVYQLKAYQIPISNRQSRGISLSILLPIEENERITAIFPVPEDLDSLGKIVMVTSNGRIKLSNLKEYVDPPTKGKRAISLIENDKLVGARALMGDEDIILISKKGYLARFSANCLRDMGRTARGVCGMRTIQDDEVIDVETYEPEKYLLLVTKLGYGVKISLADIPQKKNRGIKGVKGLKLRENDEVVEVVKISEDDELVVMSGAGKTIRLTAKEIRQVNRNGSSGVKLMSLEEGDTIRSVALVGNEEV
ncbi:MAG: DNA gyrase subunit A [bacterium]